MSDVYCTNRGDDLRLIVHVCYSREMATDFGLDDELKGMRDIVQKLSTNLVYEMTRLLNECYTILYVCVMYIIQVYKIHSKYFRSYVYLTKRACLCSVSCIIYEVSLEYNSCVHWIWVLRRCSASEQQLLSEMNGRYG
jgi:hypothetical protein